MNAFMLYTKTYHKIINADPDVKESYVDLFRLVPQLNQLLSCTVCSQLLQIPYSPKTECQHHICKSCVGVKKLINCSQCDDYTDYFENQSFRLLLQCYKKMCEYFVSTPMYKALVEKQKLGEVGYVESICKKNLINFIQDGVQLKDTFSLEEGTPSTCRLSSFLNKNGFPIEFGIDTPSQISMFEGNNRKNSDQVDNAFDIEIESQIQNSDKNDVIENLLKELPLLEGDDDPSLDDATFEINVGSKIEKPINNNIIENIVDELKLNEAENTNSDENATFNLKVQFQIQNTENNDDMENIIDELPLNEEEYNYLVDNVTLPMKTIIDAPKELPLPPTKVRKLRKIKKPAKKPNPLARRRSLMKGCRCGKATVTPGNLTCCGQRCPCYANGKPCFECKCRGCRNTRTADGLKLRLHNFDSDTKEGSDVQSTPAAPVIDSIDTEINNEKSEVVHKKDEPSTSQTESYNVISLFGNYKPDAPFLPHVLARLSPTRFFLDEDSQDDFEKT